MDPAKGTPWKDKTPAQRRDAAVIGAGSLLLSALKAVLLVLAAFVAAVFGVAVDQNKPKGNGGL